jgi:hypothetical protein
MLTRRQLGTGAAALLAAGSARAGSLEADAVSNRSPVRSVLWSWTTGEQIAELRGGSPLFTRVTNKDGERGYLSQVLQKKTGLACELLRSRRFDKGRFGWWNPWATCDGFIGERWGERLLRIELVPRAWLAVVRSSQPGAQVLDLDNRPVTEEQLRANPARLAGAFFVHDALTGGERWECDPSFGGWAKGYREVYLGDEALVGGWSCDSAQIRERITAAADGLETLAKAGATAMGNCRWQDAVMTAWDSGEHPADALEAYRRGLAFSSLEYNATAGNLKRLANLLRARFI